SLLVLVLVLVVFSRPESLNVSGLFRAADQKKQALPKKEAVGQMTKTKEAEEAPAEPREAAPQEAAVMPEKQAQEPAALQEAPPEEPARAVPKDLAGILKGLDSRASRHGAMEAAIELWQGESDINRYLANVEDDRAFFQFAAKQNGLLMQQIEKDFEMVKRLNLPAILEFYLPGSLAPKYLTLTRLSEDKMEFMAGESRELVQVESKEFKALWTGTAYIPWKNFLDYDGTIPLNAPRDSIITLKMLIHDIGFDHIEINPFYDAPTKEAVREIQQKNGISADGIVGPLTKIILYNEKKSLKIPHIMDR
ncbi:MAG: peptidoglycan-binding protein, partial [Pseudomonadota bacterium]